MTRWWREIVAVVGLIMSSMLMKRCAAAVLDLQARMVDIKAAIPAVMIHWAVKDVSSIQRIDTIKSQKSIVGTNCSTIQRANNLIHRSFFSSRSSSYHISWYRVATISRERSRLWSTSTMAKRSNLHVSYAYTWTNWRKLRRPMMAMLWPCSAYIVVPWTPLAPGISIFRTLSYIPQHRIIVLNHRI